MTKTTKHNSSSSKAASLDLTSIYTYDTADIDIEAGDNAHHITNESDTNRPWWKNKCFFVSLSLAIAAIICIIVIAVVGIQQDIDTGEVQSSAEEVSSVTFPIDQAS